VGSFLTNSAIAGLFLGRDATREEPVAVDEHVLQLFDLHRVALLGYARSLGLPMQDSEDVIQEAFLALFHHLRKGKSQENLRAWLYRVVHNLGLKRRMTLQTQQKLCEQIEDHDVPYRASTPDPEAAVLFGERYVRLMAVMSALPENDQLCLRLRAEGFRYREIAETLGIALGSVANSLTRSLSRLQAVDEGEA
jgi:RNA polymerase sigma-70 factor, ECF subfamily